MLKRALALSLLMATAAGAQTAPAVDLLPPLVCIGHADLVTKLKTEGSVQVAAGTWPDGRKLEIYHTPKGDIWTSVIVQRPKGGSVTKTMCSIIFGRGDPGVVVPAGPLP